MLRGRRFHQRRLWVFTRGSKCLILVWSEWQIEAMTLMNGDIEEELRGISIREGPRYQTHESHPSARTRELNLQPYEEALS